MSTLHTTSDNKQLRCKRPLSLEHSLSINKPYGDKKNDHNSTKHKKHRRGMSSTAWNVDVLPAIPHFHIKEKTSVAVMNVKAQCVADRIYQCAKLLSVDCSYDDYKAGATVGIDQMELCIQLFKASDNTPNVIVVEIRRKNGSPIIFHRVARTILNAAKGGPIVLAPYFTTPPSSQNKPCVAKDEQKKQDVIRNIDSLLQKDRVDANLLGMESLLYLTTCGSSSKTMALFTADVVLNGCKSDVIKDTVFSLVRRNSNNDRAKDQTENVVEDDFNQRLRICALSVFANSLELLSKPDLVSKLSDADEDWVGDNGVLSSLVIRLKDSESSLQEAYFAAKCLKTVLEASIDLRSWAIERKVFKAVQHSQNIGHCAHNLLGCISDDILLCLGKSITS